MSRSQIHTISTVSSPRQPINHPFKSLLWISVSARPCSGADEPRPMPFIHPWQEGAAGSELIPGSQGCPWTGLTGSRGLGVVRCPKGPAKLLFANIPGEAGTLLATASQCPLNPQPLKLL